MASRNLTALLGLLAIAGWQNRDRIAEWVNSATGQKPGDPSGDPSKGASAGTGVPSPGAGGLGGVLGGLLGGASSGQVVSGGLGELLDSFTGSGHGDVADSWVQTGPNKDVGEPQLADALGNDTIDQLAKQTGLSRDELLSRLKSILPAAVDKLTPQGRLPTEDETSNW